MNIERVQAMTKRIALKQIAPPDPDQIMMAGVAPVSMGERLGWLANQPMQPNVNSGHSTLASGIRCVTRSKCSDHTRSACPANFAARPSGRAKADCFGIRPASAKRIGYLRVSIWVWHPATTAPKSVQPACLRRMATIALHLTAQHCNLKGSR